jgi:hypothetical protein
MADRRALCLASGELAEIGAADRQVLSGDPTTSLHAVPKQYADRMQDTLLAEVSTSNTAAQNTAAIQAAITTEGSSGLGVRLPGGTYDHDGIVLPAAGKVTICGAGRGRTILRNVHATNPSFTARGTAGGPYCPEWKLEGLTLSASARRTNQIGLDVELSHLFTVRDISITGHYYGVSHKSAWDCTFDTVNVNTCSTGWFFPVPVYTSASPVNVINGSAWGCDTAVYIADGLECLNWVGGDFAQSILGLVVLGNATRTLNFSGVNFEGMTNECVTIGDGTTGPSAITFDSCRFLKTGTANVRAVQFVRGAGVAMTGCWFSGYTTAILQDSTSGDFTYDACSIASAQVGTFFTDRDGYSRPVNPPRRTAARIYSTVDQVITPPADYSLVAIVLGGSDFNFGDMGTATANRRAATVAGPHVVTVSVTFDGGTVGPRFAAVTLNGVSVREFSPPSDTNANFVVNGTEILALAVGDQVGLSVYVGGTGTAVTVKGTYPKQTGLSLGLLGAP